MLLLMATLIMARLYWQAPAEQNTQHILVTQDWLLHATKLQRNKLIDNKIKQKITLLGTPNQPLTAKTLEQWETSSTQHFVNSKALNVWEKVTDYSSQFSENTAISVYTTNRLSQFTGVNNSSATAIDWQIKAVPVKTDGPSIQAKILVLYDSSSVKKVPFLEAAFSALQTNQQLVLSVHYAHLQSFSQAEYLNLASDKVISLSTSPLPDWLEAIKGLPSKAWVNTGQLPNIKQADFPLALFDVLFKRQAQDWLFANTRLSEQQIIISQPNASSKKSTSTALPAQAQTLHYWLVLLLVILFIFERVLSELSIPTSQPAKAID
jgi:hypothetical protein